MSDAHGRREPAVSSTPLRASGPAEAPDPPGSAGTRSGAPRSAPPRRVGRLLALGLLVLSPICAEYLSAYDETTGHPLVLLFGLLIFGPLYGAPALLIRETARRFGVRWPGILAMATAFGIIQAGVVDQSLFSESYRQIDYWDSMIQPTWIEPLGIAGNTVMTFIVGHAVWSFGIPIALVESARPELSRQPWLRWPGLVVTALLYLAAAAAVLGDHLANEQDHASPAQVTGAIVIAVLLVVLALTVGRRRVRPRAGRVPSPLIVGTVSLAAAFGFQFVGASWLGTVGGIAILAVSAAAVAHLSRSESWDGRHVAALATGGLLAMAIVGFFTVPLGDIDPIAKYAHNIVLFAGSAALGFCAIRRNRPAAPVSTG